MNDLKSDKGLRLLAILPMGIAINLVIGLTVTSLKLPVFLDAIGTVFFTILCGWRIGAAIGVLSFLLGGVVNPVLPFFIGTQFTIAAIAGMCAARGGFRTLLRTLVSGVLIGAAAAVVSTPVIAALFGGVTTSGESLITAFFINTGRSLWESVATTKVWTEPLDKTLQCFAAVVLVRSLPKTLLRRLETSRSFMRENNLL